MINWLSNHIILLMLSVVSLAYIFVAYEAFREYLASSRLAASKRLNSAIRAITSNHDIDPQKRGMLLMYAFFASDKSFARLFIKKFKDKTEQPYKRKELDKKSYSQLKKKQFIIKLENELMLAALDVACCSLNRPWATNDLTQKIRKLICVYPSASTDKPSNEQIVVHFKKQEFGKYAERARQYFSKAA